jgi:hypothetical protein
VECHDAAPTWFNAMAPSRSPITDNYVADGGVVRNNSKTANSPKSLGSSFSSPLLDDESGNHTSLSPFSQATTISASSHGPTQARGSPVDPRNPNRVAGPSGMVAVPTLLPHGRFSCPQCPRKFWKSTEARYRHKIFTLGSIAKSFPLESMFKGINIPILARFVGVDGSFIYTRIFFDTLRDISPLQSENVILALSLDAALPLVGETC